MITARCWRGGRGDAPSQGTDDSSCSAAGREGQPWLRQPPGCTGLTRGPAASSGGGSRALETAAAIRRVLWPSLSAPPAAERPQVQRQARAGEERWAGDGDSHGSEVAASAFVGLEPLGSARFPGGAAAPAGRARCRALSRSAPGGDPAPPGAPAAPLPRAPPSRGGAAGGRSALVP